MSAAGLWQGCCGRAVAGLRATAAVELWQLLLLLRFSCCSAVGGGGGAAAREPEGEALQVQSEPEGMEPASGAVDAEP